ncbi:MAG: hypothetical protein RIT16_575, partial [Actinomycetota bacterium]
MPATPLAEVQRALQESAEIKSWPEFNSEMLQEQAHQTQIANGQLQFPTMHTRETAQSLKKSPAVLLIGCLNTRASP